MKAARDLARALSNPALYNPDHPYAAARASTAAELGAARRPQRCAGAARRSPNFYDREFNPDGSRAGHRLLRRQRRRGARPRHARSGGAGRPTHPRSCWRSTSTSDGRARPGRAGHHQRGRAVRRRRRRRPRQRPTSRATTPRPTPTRPATTTTTSATRAAPSSNRRLRRRPSRTSTPASTASCRHLPARRHAAGRGEPLLRRRRGRRRVWTLSPNVATLVRERRASTRLAALTPGPARPRRACGSTPASATCPQRLALGQRRAPASSAGQYGLPLAVFDGFQVHRRHDAPRTRYDFTDGGRGRTRCPATWLPALRRPPTPPRPTSTLGDGRHVGTAGPAHQPRHPPPSRGSTSSLPGGDRDDELGAGDHPATSSRSWQPSSGRDTPYGAVPAAGLRQARERRPSRYPVVYFLHGYGQEPADLLSAVGRVRGLHAAVQRSSPGRRASRSSSSSTSTAGAGPASTPSRSTRPATGASSGTFYKRRPARRPGARWRPNAARPGRPHRRHLPDQAGPRWWRSPREAASGKGIAPGLTLR
jgi:hypothetical protein